VRQRRAARRAPATSLWRALAVSLLGAGVLLAGPGQALADPPDDPLVDTGVADGSASTVLLLPGFDFDNNGGDCAGGWARTIKALAADGHVGQILTVSSSWMDVNCDVSLAEARFAKDGDPYRQDPPGTSPETYQFTYDTSIRHLAYKFAWLASSSHSQYGQPVSVIAESMGGVVVRLAVAEATLGDPDFPSVADMGLSRVVTLGSPHRGAALATAGTALQAAQLQPASDVIQLLRSTAFDGGAEWLALSSTLLPDDPERMQVWMGDGVVRVDSACWNRATWCVRYDGLVHGYYVQDEARTLVPAVAGPPLCGNPVQVAGAEQVPNATYLAADWVTFQPRRPDLSWDVRPSPDLAPYLPQSTGTAGMNTATLADPEQPTVGPCS
jgi:hypothetical protein